MPKKENSRVTTTNKIKNISLVFVVIQLCTTENISGREESQILCTRE
jgi:hypothetical protein